MATNDTTDLARRVVDTAIVLAEEDGWESVRLHRVAERLGIGLDQIRACFREKDQLIDAWFDRADDAVLRLADSGELARLTPRERLFALIMAWLDAQEEHRRVSRQMIQAKLEPGHLHIQLPQLTRISRTVQWIREGALLEDSGMRRALLESAVTAIYLATFTRWMAEDAPGSPRTRRFLDRTLHNAESLIRAVPFLAGVKEAVRTDAA